MSKFTSDIARAVRHELLDPEFIARKAGRIFWAKSTDDADFATFAAEHPPYEDGVPAVYSDLQLALDAVGKSDAILVFPGGWQGDYTTPLNAVAPFVSLIGINATDLGLGPYLHSTTVSTPTLEVRARGWRISGFEFDNPSGAESIRLTKTLDLTSRADYTQIDHCLFTGGMYGINFYGGGTYIYIKDNVFDLMTGATSIAITCTNSDYQVPGMCRIISNDFLENKKHIDMGGLRGFNSSIITDNYFQLDGNAVDATVLLDIRQSGTGNNSIRRNFFGCTIAQFKDGSSTAFVRGNSGDLASYDNYCSDGVIDGNIGE